MLIGIRKTGSNIEQTVGDANPLPVEMDTSTDALNIDRKDDAFAIGITPVTAQQTVTTTPAAVNLQGITPGNIASISVSNIGSADVYIGWALDLTSSSKSNKLGIDSTMDFFFQDGSSAPSALAVVMASGSGTISITIRRRR